MIYSHVMELCKSAIFCVIVGLSDNFTVRAESAVLMASTKGEAESDDSEACDNFSNWPSFES